ncbi:putative signal transducing protein [Capnocytophaga canimorsus]|uniref:DUF2007 domain-containing protein n=1 Tax=Capnocytophaga canimorsus TaxID=28188 RepID=A0A0B7IG38_9FLAO|nr:DUF2007 domain-containing protein [Capnocytophaga canimorsus]ATA76650.1 DUF2007 domain-containing protein [Capnocytophaga canimorsus]ATA91263.1 DUF2007 domain-containing protein [Capnocytophaga canimorsus]AWL78110.1 DUF2007 domain-containing protein [Capnocytophaga canimorsus]AYW36746.1 DUF2007 domain-containing protein [Capnocytophaga canimorsus]MDT9499424.1 DUF2007 domain-containing protein [Capnocytophaga canimorsus]
MLETKLRKLFEGSIIEVQRLKSALEEAGIQPIVKDRSESGILAGFAGEIFMQAEVFVFEDQYAIAYEILKAIEENY